MDEEPREGNHWFPRPPRIATSADFVVIIFAVTVATIMLVLTIGTVIAGIVGVQIKSYFAVIASIVTSMISALVGYLAGRGQTKLEDRDHPPKGEE